MEKRAWKGVDQSIAKGLRNTVRTDTPTILQLGNWAKHKLKPWSAHEAKQIAGAKSKEAISAIKEKLKHQRYKPMNEAYAKHIGDPVSKVDVNLGSKAHSFTKKHISGDVADALFKEKQLHQIKSPSGAHTGKHEVEVPSVLAPIHKAGKFVVPMLGFAKAQELLEKRKMEKQGSITKADLQKTAAMLRSLKDQRNWLEKKARATSILFKQAELGQIEFPKTAAVYEEKIAELIGKDLNVVEEAIKMAAPNFNSYGSLVPDNTGIGTNPAETFKRSLMTDF